ncbi:MAG: hypothetical protein ACXVAU_05245, partial [Mucilaginibacter sp.]
MIEIPQGTKGLQKSVLQVEASLHGTVFLCPVDFLQHLSAVQALVCLAENASIWVNGCNISRPKYITNMEAMI